MTDKHIVLLHGWGANVAKLGPLAKELTKLGWTTYALKLPGFDLPLAQSDWTLASYADYVRRQLADKYDKKPIVIYGHSFGGRILLKLFSDTQPVNVKGLVLNAASGLSRDNVAKRWVLLLLSKGNKFAMRLPVVGGLATKLDELGQKRYYSRAQGNLKLVFQAVVKENLKPLVSKITTPTLVIWGQKDKLTPIADAKYLLSHLAHAESVIYPDGDHLLPYTKPDKLAQNITTWAARL